MIQVDTHMTRRPHMGVQPPGGLFWLVANPLLERSVLNLIIMVQQAWKATVATVKALQES